VATHGSMAKYHLAERVQAGQFAFTAYQSGDYVICFVDKTEDPQIALSIDFEWRTGMATIDRHSIAKKTNVDVSFSIYYYKIYKTHMFLGL